MNNKKCFNLILEESTKITYLDPIFKVFLLAGLELNKYQDYKGIIALPIAIDSSVLNEWKQSYKDECKKRPLWCLFARENSNIFSLVFFKPLQLIRSSFFPKKQILDNEIESENALLERGIIQIHRANSCPIFSKKFKV